MIEKSPSRPWSKVLRIADLSHRHATRFAVEPDSVLIQAIADDLGLLGLRKLRFKGEVAPAGKSDWTLTAKIGATVQQPCVVTLDPVTTRIDETVERKFLAEKPEHEAGSEHEMDADETIDYLGDTIDVGEIMVEALAVLLPLYPRAKGVAPADAVFTEPGVTPMTDEQARPFAGLGALRDQLKNGGEEDPK